MNEQQLREIEERVRDCDPSDDLEQVARDRRALLQHIRSMEAELREARTNALYEAAEMAEKFSGFTGANYCDMNHPSFNPHVQHDYGRGGNDVRRMIASAIRDLCKRSALDAAMEKQHG